MWRDFQVEQREKFCKRLCNEIGTPNTKATLEWSHQDRYWRLSIKVDGRWITKTPKNQVPDLLIKEVIEWIREKHSCLLI